MAVGTAPWDIKLNARMPKRMPVNPLDKSTIVSVYPEEIYESKLTIFPGHFYIAPVTEGFGLTIIGPSSWFKELGPDEPFIEIPTSSINMAQSIIRDWAQGLPECNMGDKMPGLFFVPGEHTAKTILTFTDPMTGKPFPTLLSECREKQKNWFAALVKQADVLWSRTNGNPLSVSKHAKMAARLLGMATKPWLQDERTLEMKPCPACGEMVNHSFPVCRHCKNVINKKQAEEMGIAFAK